MPRRLAQHLISQSLLPADQVDEALRKLDGDDVGIDTLLLELGHISEAGMLQALSDVSGYRHVNLADFEPNEEAAALLPLRIAQRLKVAPLSVQDKTLHLVVPYPVPAKQLKEVEFLIGKKLELWVGLECRIRDWLSWQYHQPLDVRFTRLLAMLDPTRQAVADAVETSDVAESLSDEVMDRIAKGFVEEPVLLVKRKGTPSASGNALAVMNVPPDHTVVIDTRAYEAFARGKHSGRAETEPVVDDGDTTVLDISAYGAFAREVSKDDVTRAAPRTPREAEPSAEPEPWSVPPSHAHVSPPLGVFFPGGVLPAAKPRHDESVHEQKTKVADTQWVRAAPPPRPSSAPPRFAHRPPPPPPPSGPYPFAAPLPPQQPPSPSLSAENHEVDFSDVAPPPSVPRPAARAKPPVDDELDFSDVAPKPTVPPAPASFEMAPPPSAPPAAVEAKPNIDDELDFSDVAPKPTVPPTREAALKTPPTAAALGLGPTPTTERNLLEAQGDAAPYALGETTAPTLLHAPIAPHPSFPSPPPAKATPHPRPTPKPMVTPPPSFEQAPTSPRVPLPRPSVPPALQVYAQEWTLTQARAALKASTHERDKLIHTVMLYGRRTFDFVGFFSVSKGAAQGFEAMTDGELPAMRQISIPLDAASVFRTITLTRGSYVGPLPPDSLSKQYLQLFGREPRTVFLCPVEVKSKLVAIVYGDCGHKPMSQRKLSDFILFCQELPAAFNELILKKRQAAKGGPPISAPVPPPLPHLSPPTRATDADWFNSLLVMLTGPEVSARRQALEWLERTPAASAKALAQHFPGPTAWSRLPVVELPEADELGPLAGALSRLGRFGAQALAPLLDAEDSDTRYLALLTAGSLPYAELVDGVLRGVFDLEPDISSAARTAAARLKGLPEFQKKIPPLRQELASKDPLRRSLAARALGGLHDRLSIDGLIGLTASDDAMCAESAAEALKEITCATFGVDPRAWTSWWAGARQRRRLEWLLDALAADDFDSRLSAIEELSLAFSDNLGFFADGPKPEREAALTRWKNFVQARGDFDL
ncbi:MAG: FrgA protein [Myxococcaceae bacterium]|nr:FrgA protein [Myxococcaceae bacterium]